METYNDFVAVAPFETTSLRVKVENGIALHVQRKELTKLTVVFPTSDHRFAPRDTIWVRGECMKHDYAKEIFEQDGTKFVLVPVSEIRAVQRWSSMDDGK